MNSAHLSTEIIPKFACLLDRGSPLLLHGDGTNTRRYLFAGDAADAFDTILHKGRVGEIYNVDSRDEVSNLDLALKLLAHFDIPAASARTWIQYTKDRPFNDRRYAVDGTKLRALGWEQKTRLEQGLKITVDWYHRFGKTWWGDIDCVLTPFPLVQDGEVYADAESKKRPAIPIAEVQTNGSSKKRALENDKENVDVEAKKRAMFADHLTSRNGVVAL